MTLIKPNKRDTNLIATLLIIAVFLLIGASLSLVVSYNGVVQRDQRLQKATAELQQLQAENVALKEQLVGLFAGPRVQEVVRARDLLQDRSPAYLQASPWEVASR